MAFFLPGLGTPLVRAQNVGHRDFSYGKTGDAKLTAWAAPEVLPVGAAAEGLASNDISAVIAFQGNKIGVMWSNQVNGLFSFAVHNDADPAATWQAPETPLGGPASFCAGSCAGPDINLKTSSTGQVFAAVLTAMTTPSDAPGALLLVRGAAGGWSSNVFGSVFDNHNRPIVELDEEAGQVYVLGASGGVIYEKSSPINGIQFVPGLGRPFISSSTDTTIDRATSTKQNVDSPKGLTVLGSDENTDFYLHNNVQLAARAPSISSFTPTAGLVGSSVQISGAAFTGAAGVAFNGAPAAFTVDSATLIAATVPPGATTGKLSVTTPAGTAFSSVPFTVDSTAPPTVSSFSPTGTWVGAAITVTGTSFTGTVSVAFNGAPGAFTVNSDTQITVVVPPAATSGPIAVTNTLGTAASSASFVVKPVIRSFSPTTGPMGTVVTINGTGFSGATRVSINDDPPTAFIIVSSNLIQATVLGGATSGKVKVTTPQYGAVTTTNFTVASTAPPVINYFSPLSGPVGAYIMLYGANFTGTTAVTYNGTTAAPFEGISDTVLETIVPAGATSGPIKVTNTAGSVTSSTNFRLNNALPLINSFSPTSGSLGTPVIITGINFTSATAVSFNWTPATFTAISSTQINTSVPAGATSGSLRVVTPQGTAATNARFTVSSQAAPTIISFSPASAPTGSAVTITGAGFTGATAVIFNGTPATFTVVSSAQISAAVPAVATTGPIKVTSSAGTATSSTNFVVQPQVTGFSPTSGAMGAAVTLTGSGFNGATAVYFDPTTSFNGTPAAFSVVSSTQISTGVPAGAASGRIKVVTSAGTGTSVASFTVLSTAAPAISSFSPTSGVVGTTVTLTGTNFTGTTAVRFNGAASTNFKGVSNTQLTVVVPAGASSGPVAVTNAAGSATSAETFTVKPKITGFAPASGSMGAAVTINGNTFTGATAVYFDPTSSFNGTPATFTVLSDAQISTSVPGGATSGKVRVVTPSGAGTSSASFTVNSTAAPTISSFSPASGVVATTVTLAGANFTGTKTVSFNGTTTTNFKGISTTQLAVVAPPGATTGRITLTNTVGSATSSTNFTVKPKITSFSPTSGSVGAAVTITGYNFTGATSVNFNGTAATFTVVSDTTITTTVPSGATSGPISVTTPSGSGASSTSFTVN